MARTKKSQQHYTAGEKGRNRVRVFPDPKTGMFQIEYRRNGRRESRSLKHRDFDLAKDQADKLAANFPLPEPEPEPEVLTLGRLFDMYLGEVTPSNGRRHQEYDNAASTMFVGYFGKQRPASTLNVRDWTRFIADRTAGRMGPGPGPWQSVGERTVQKDLSFLMSVLNWATMARDGRGGALLERNPLKGLPLPKEKSPHRVTLTDGEYDALLDVAPKVGWRFHVTLVLAHETGHRIGAIRMLPWSDVDLPKREIRWRAEHDKTGYEHRTPMTDEARAVLEMARRMTLGIGEAPVLPSLKDDSRPVSRYLARDWWERAEKLARLKPKRGRGWHSLRRKFASDLMHKPLKVLCELGGWKDPSTVLKCYQLPDQEEMREALEDRKRVAGPTE